MSVSTNSSLRGHTHITGLCAGGRITAVTCCDDSQSVASGSSDGSLHVWRVEHTCRAAGAPDRYTGVTARRQVPSASVLAICSHR